MPFPPIWKIFAFRGSFVRPTNSGIKGELQYNCRLREQNLNVLVASNSKDTRSLPRSVNSSLLLLTILLKPVSISKASNVPNQQLKHVVARRGSAPLTIDRDNGRNRKCEVVQSYPNAKLVFYVTVWICCR